MIIPIHGKLLAGPLSASFALDARDGMTRHVMVGFSEPPDGNQAEATSVSQTTTAATTTSAAVKRSRKLSKELKEAAMDTSRVALLATVGSAVIAASFFLSLTVLKLLD